MVYQNVLCFSKAPVYDWSPQIQGIIFSSINYGMILTLAPSGYLAGRVGTKRVVGVSLFGSSLLVLFTPLAANLGLVFLIATRILQGLNLVPRYFINMSWIWISIWDHISRTLFSFQGAGYGGQFALWEKWSPPHERSRLCSIAVSGKNIKLKWGHYNPTFLQWVLWQFF